MGCDIHMYVEYTSKEELEKYQRGEKRDIHGNPAKPYWMDFGGRVNPGRNYDMFGFLCKGVRSDHSNGFPRKGLPPFDELAYASRNDSVLYITDKGNGDNEVTLERALEWAKYDQNKLHYNSTGDKPVWVDNPDWHSHSWLTTQEFEEAINRFIEYIKSDNDDGFYTNYEPQIEYGALLAAMKYIESRGQVARIVFWFDN